MKLLPHSTLIILMFTIIMDVMGVGLVLPLLPNLIISVNSPFHLNDSLLYYGIILALWSLGGFFGSPFLGSFSDKIGRKKILILALFCNALIYTLSALSIVLKWIGLFMIMRFCSGFFSGSFELAQASVADKSSQEEKAKNMSYMILAFALGSIVGPFLSSMTINLGLIMPFILAAILSFLNSICLFIFFRETHERKEIKINWISLLVSFTFMFKDIRIKKIAMIFFIFQFAWGYYFQSISLVLQEVYHFVAKDISIFFIVLGVGFAIVPLFLQKLMMRFFLIEKIAVIGLTISGISIGLGILFNRFVEIQWLVVLLFAIFESLAFSSLLSILSNKVSKEEQGKLMGGCGALFAISFILIGFSLGYLSAMSIWIGMILSSFFFFLSAALLAWQKKTS